MRDFLRYLYVMTAMLMVVVGDVWGQCDVLISDNGSYEVMNKWSTAQTKNFDISNPLPCNQLTFNYSAGTWPTGGVDVTATYSDGSSEKIISAGNGSSQSYNFNRKIVKSLTFKGTGTIKKYISNVKLTTATYADQPSATSWPADSKIIGSPDETTIITMAWSNTAAFSCEITGGGKDRFSAEITEGNASTCSYGTAKILVKYKHDVLGTHNASLKISNGTYTYNIALSGTTLPKQTVFSWNLVNEYLVGDEAKLIDIYNLKDLNNVDIKNDLHSYIKFASTQPSVVVVENGKIVAKNEGTATISATFPGENGWESFEHTITLNISKRTADFAWLLTEPSYHVDDNAELVYIYTLKDNATGADVLSELHDLITFDSNKSSIVSIKQNSEGKWGVYAENAGDAKVTATFDGNYKWNAFTYELPLNIIKYTPVFTWNPHGTPYYYGSSISNIFSTTNTSAECTVTFTTDNEAFARVENNTLYIANLNETATITVEQKENYKWYGLKKDYLITPVNGNTHVRIEINDESEYYLFKQSTTSSKVSWSGGVKFTQGDAGFNWDDTYYDIHFEGIPDKLTFDYDAQFGASDILWFVSEKSSAEEEWVGTEWSSTDDNGSASISLRSSTRYVRFCYSGNLSATIKNIVVTEKVQFDASPNPLDFGTQPVGEGEQLLPLNFSHTNAGRITTATIIGKDAKYFTVTPTVIPGTGRDMSGTTHLNVTFANNGEDRGLTPYEATLVITDNAGNREEVPLTGVRHGKATPKFTWNPNNFPYYFNTSIANIVVSSNTDYANCPLTITSSNENIAKVENGRLYIYDQSGEVTFTVTQRGNDRYNEHTESFTFTPKAKPDLEVPFQVTQPIYGQAITVGDNCSWDGDDHHLKLGDGAWDDTKKTAILVFSGRPDKLTFRYATSSNVAVVEIGQTGNPQWEVEESSDGENWHSIWSVRTNSTSWADAEIPLSETTQYVRFSYDGNFAGYFKNINISELVGYKYLRAADGHYLSRGAKWGTQAVVDAFGVVSRISNYTQDNENVYTRFFFVDNEQYMFETETQDDQRLHEVFTDHGTADNTNQFWQINNNGGILTIQSANDVGVSHRGNYITAVNGVLAFTTNEAEATKWQMEDYTEHPQYIADMLNRQAAEAALKDFGEEINTLEKVRNRLKVEDFETLEIDSIQPLALGEQTGEGRTIEGMPHIYEDTITGLDTGFYRLTVKALYRISNSEIAWKCNQEKGKESVLAYAYANDVQYPIQSVYASYHSSAIENTDEWRDGKYYSTTLSSANIAFNDANRYLNDVYVYVEADPGKTTGTLRYGIKCPSYVPGAWLAYSTITLTRFARKEYIFEGSDTENPKDWNTEKNWNRGAVPSDYHNVIIKADIDIISPTSIYGITIDENKTIHIQSTGGLTIGKEGIRGAKEGSIIIDNTPEGVGYLKVHPNATNKPAKVTVNYVNNAYDSGNPRDEVWQYMGAPGEGMTISSAEKTTIYHWDEVKGWVKQSGASLEPFVGYAFTQSLGLGAPFTVTATPMFPDETKEINLTVTESGMGGSNLFVNSFLAPIDLTTFTGNEFEGGVVQTFYLYNSGSWKQWQEQGGKDEMKNGSSPGQYYAINPLGAGLLDKNLDQTTIPPMQGVYVVAQGTGGKIKLDYMKHVYGGVNNNRPMRAPEMEDENFKRVRLQVNSDNSGADRMYVIQHPQQTADYDNGYDAENIAIEGQVSIYTDETAGQMEISVSDNIDSTYIGFQAGCDSEYQLRITSVIGEELYLKDLENDVVMSLVDDEVYTFYATPNSTNNRRFLLLERSPEEEDNGVSTDIDDVKTISLWIADKMVYVANAPLNSELVVYNMGGLVMAKYAVGYTPCTVDLSHLSTGVYLLRLGDKAYKMVCK